MGRVEDIGAWGLGKLGGITKARGRWRLKDGYIKAFLLQYTRKAIGFRGYAGQPPEGVAEGTTK
jgi:hypothetical protein